MSSACFGLKPSSLVGIAVMTGFFMVFLFVGNLDTTNMDNIGMEASFLLHGVDMHTHTTESDGNLSPDAIIKEAQMKNLSVIWVTDHDMIREPARTAEIVAAGDRAGIEVNFGVEITVGWLKKEHHLLGYFPNAVWTKKLSKEMVTLQKACAEVKASREKRNKDMTDWLNSALGPLKPGNIDSSVYFLDPNTKPRLIVLKEVAEWAETHADLSDKASLGRPHFAKYLIEERGVNPELVFGPRAGDGIAKVVGPPVTKIEYDPAARDAIKGGQLVQALLHSSTLADKGIGFIPLPIEDGIKMINDAGGRAVIAHLPTLGKKWRGKFADDLPRLKTLGLWGLECWSSEVSKEDHAVIESLADKYGLAATAGSDTHGTLKKYARLGYVYRGEDGSHRGHRYPAVQTWEQHGREVSDKLRRAADAAQAPEL